ncbi:hypothetical protein ACVW01_001237 [Thermostichus sp. MS-CIW-19]|jgi:hypothetical protein|uniref:hypothetical protein n=1 Tax=unclassified Synechococcus TaxID=2626047 RepID=UPI00006941FA|nr:MULTISPECIES: hypothetical protein [unclassified Synechococcus]ABC99083.1 conserved hypothetical protein [Synechococcus sp. JA-3-3Ab]PIK85540.1 hypothetical protein SYN63AY4M2_03235 [Synechococcus sp. 63AY4M2]PIK88804.1 hypothetical protein SYN65AY6A5_07030 [Synechococcus sp. 65AY6A5]PIK90861.1 hypothetical protein SYN65AY6LI_00380 [Synechococcus sp. 65AY6Li]
MTFATSESKLEQKQELEIQRHIRLAEDELVARIQTALDNFKGLSKLEEAQYRNLLHVAASTESSEVIKNFLRYQMGRDEKWGRGKNSLAEAIIQDIDNWIHQKALAIAQKAGVEERSPKVNEIKIDLIRRYLGYGARYLKYKREGGGS